LVETGFLLYVEYQRKNKQKKLFSELKLSAKNGYGLKVQKWFARYLDNLRIKSETKIFHSFRHTFETRAVELKMPTEYQNALCGWRDDGIGQRIYGHKRDIRVMYEELSKISFPIKRELQELEKMFKTSYVINLLSDG